MASLSFVICLKKEIIFCLLKIFLKSSASNLYTIRKTKKGEIQEGRCAGTTRSSGGYVIIGASR
jgi:hypothetical protein